MATAIPAKALPHPPKMKRAPPPFVQTFTNGTKPSNPSQSPSTSSKRPPGQKLPPSTSTANGVTINAASVRSANRQRKESQRPGDAYDAKRQRLNTRSGAIDVSGVDRRTTRKFPEPYAPSEDHILKKFAGRPPSLIIHLHSTHFRFDQQDGSFPYNSEMKYLLEHIKKRTIPHEMMEDLRKSDVRFYDGWLIVRVVDHKSGAKSSNSSTSSTDDKDTPFSVHNYNPYITPSPYAPFPGKDQPRTSKDGAKPSSPKPLAEEGSSTQAVNGEMGEVIPEDAPSEDTIEVVSKQSPKSLKPILVALRPTQLSRLADLTINSMTPDPKLLNRRQSQAVARTPGSATVPPTPLSAVPPTPLAERGPPNKKIKMMIEPKELLEFEAEIVNATAPPLYLEPVSSLEAARDVFKMLSDPYHNEAPPSPKSRKRTIAELAADEALAAEEERFMLIMDERLAPGASGAGAATKAAATDGQTGTSTFEPRFSRFKALENIRANHEENRKREHERQQQASIAKRMQQEQQAAQRKEEELRAIEQTKKMQQVQRQREAAMMAQQASLAAQHQQQPNGMMPGLHAQQQMMHASQAQHSSPVVRTSTPQNNSSPLVGNFSQPGQSVPMSVTSSNQGAGSPQRPGSALQHAHPGVAAAMARQQSQQVPSRNGTPQMPQGTPNIRQATPVMRNVTPSQSRMSHSSPVGSMLAQTPVMSQAMMGTPQMNGMNGMNMTPEQQMLQIQQHQQQRQQQIAQQQMLNMQANGQQQMSTAQIAHIQAQHQARQQAQLAAAYQQSQQNQAQQQLQQGHPQQQQQMQQMQQFQQTDPRNAYNAQLRRITEQQMQNQQQSMHQGSPQQQMQTPQMNAQQMHANQQASQQQQQLRQPGNAFQQQYQMRFNTYRQSLTQQVIKQYGQSPPQHILEQAITSAKNRATREVQNMMAQQAAANASGVQNPQMNQPPQQQANGGNGMAGMDPTSAEAQMRVQQVQQAQRIRQMQMLAQQQQQQAQAQQAQQHGMMNGMPGTGVLPK